MLITAPVDALTRRERVVLELMAQGLSNDAICQTLFLSGKTVEAHIRSIYMKLTPRTSAQPAIHRRVHAVLQFLDCQAA